MIRRLYLSAIFVLCAIVSFAQWDQSDTYILWNKLDDIQSKIDGFQSSSDFYLFNIADTSSMISSNVGSFKSVFDTFYEEYQRSVVDYTSTPHVPNGSHNVNLTWDPYTYRTLSSITNSVLSTEDYNKQQLQVQKDILSFLTTNKMYQASNYTNMGPYTLYGSRPYGISSSSTGLVYAEDVYEDLIHCLTDPESQVFAYSDYGIWREFVTLYFNLVWLNAPDIKLSDYQALTSAWQYYLGVHPDYHSQLISKYIYQQYGTAGVLSNLNFNAENFWNPASSNINSSLSHALGQTPLSDVISDDGTYHTNAPVVQTFLSSILPAGFSTPPSITNPPLTALNQDSVDSEKTDFETKNEQLTAYISPVVASINSDLSSAVQSVTSQAFGESWTINGWSGFSFGGNQIGGFSSLAMNRPSYMPSFAFIGWCIRIVIYFTFIFAVVRRYINLNRDLESNSAGTDDFL